MIVPILVVGLVLETAHVVTLHKEKRKLRKDQDTLVSVIEAQNSVILYMGDLLTRSEIELTEFDQIVMDSITRDLKERP